MIEVHLLSPQELKNNLEKHVKILCTGIGTRHIGSAGEKKAADYVYGEFKKIGYEPVKEEFSAPGWKYGKYSLTSLSIGKSFPCFPCYYSNSCDIKGKLKIVDAGSLKELDSFKVKGEICFYTGETDAGSPFGRNALAEKLDRMGARVLIIISPYQDTVNTKLIRTPHIKRLAVITVSGNTALALAKHLDDTFHIKVDAKTFPARPVNVIARLKKVSGKKIIIGAHYDSAPGTTSAIDNATGVALLIELARQFRNENINCSVDFASFGGHEYGGAGKGQYPSGSYAYAMKYKAQLKNASFICIFDGLGAPLGKSRVCVGRSKQIRNFLEKNPHSLLVKDYAGMSDDRIFHESGFPTIFFSSQFQLNQLHSPNDMISRISFTRLAEVYAIISSILKKLLK